MKSFIRIAIATIAVSSACGAAACADTTVATAPSGARSANLERPSLAAPADEYFGPLSLSVLGIRNAIAQTTLRLDLAGLSDEDDTLRNVSLIEQSVRDWEAKYPRDSWLPKMVLALHHAYRKIATDASMTHAVDTATWLMTKYPSSAEAMTAKRELAHAMSGDDDDDAPDAQPAAAAPAAGH
jgi:hypothetical protein